jgi:hypothetical protein
MQAVKVIVPSAERKPCVCGATLCLSRDRDDVKAAQVWHCDRHCGARGRTYEGALRRKIRLDLLSWDDLRRKAQALIEAESEDFNESFIQ